MAIRLITYDLSKEISSEDYTSIVGYIKDHDAWARISESCYAIETTKTAKTVYEDLESFLDSNDHLLVLTLTSGSSYHGYHSKEVVDWLSAKLR